jgi:hypothetical protein
MLCRGRTPAPVVAISTGEDVVLQVTRVLAYFMALAVVALGTRRESPARLDRSGA